MVFSAFSGAAAVVNGVLILLGQIKLDGINGGIFGSLLHQGIVGTVALIVLGAAALLYQFRDVGTTITVDRPERLPLLVAWPCEPRSLVAAIDQGTTSSRCILFDRAGQPVASHQLEHAQITPRPGWVEHDADEILERVRTCVRVALRDAGADARALAAVGISDQRETTVVWDRGGPGDRSTTRSSGRTPGPPTPCARLAAGIGGRGPVPGTDRAADLDLFVRAQAGLDPRGRRTRNGEPPPTPATCSSAPSIPGSSGT